MTQSDQPPLPFEIKNDAPNQGAQGVFNAPVYIGSALKRGLANIKITVECPVKIIKTRSSSLFGLSQERYGCPHDVSGNISIEVTEIASNSMIKKNIYSCDLYFATELYHDNYTWTGNMYLLADEDLLNIKQAIIKFFSLLDSEGWDVISVSNKVKNLLRQDFMLGFGLNATGTISTTVMDTVIRRR